MPRVRQGRRSKAKQARRRSKQHIFATITVDRAEAWIDNNVTDLASAKQALKHLAAMIILLRDSTDLVED